MGIYLNYNKEAKSLTFRRSSEVSQDKSVCLVSLVTVQATGIYSRDGPKKTALNDALNASTLTALFSQVPVDWCISALGIRGSGQLKDLARFSCARFRLYGRKVSQSSFKLEGLGASFGRT